MSINGLLNLGQSSLMGHQVAINTVGNNIANVNTVGYSRQVVRFEDRMGINTGSGLIGQGVDVAEITRQYNRFIEYAYLEEFAPHSRWSQQSLLMSSVESVFNESTDTGIANSLGEFWESWQDLIGNPSSDSTKEQLLSNTALLTSLIRDAQANLENSQREMDLYIEQSVDEVNESLAKIAELNQEIAQKHQPGISNANQLLDMRDLEVRKLAGMIDIDVIENPQGEYIITTTAGHTLVQDNIVYGLSIQDGRVENHLTIGSDYEGTVSFAGEDANEYVFEVLTQADAAAVPPVEATMRVSIDGGKSWMRNDDGTEYHVEIPLGADQPIKVKDLEIAFTADSEGLSVGDRFEVLPKKVLLWHTPTSDPINITPQSFTDGTENTNRVIGGSIAALFSVRDANIGAYKDKLDALSENLIFEVNKLYSQGAGLESMKQTLGSESVRDPSIPMGDSWSGIFFGDKLTGGGMSFQIYDENGDPLELAPPAVVPTEVEFGPPAIDGKFDPSIHSYNDLQEAINNTYGDYIQADLIDGKMQLTAVGEHSFSVRTDTTGVFAALGVNTFFEGTNALDISLKEGLGDNLNFINSGVVGSTSSNGVVEPGNAATATAIAALANAKITFNTGFETSTTSFANYYGGIVGSVGSDTRIAMYNNDLHTALAKDMSERSSALSGVNLDEEMTTLIRFQHSYTAAAKLITTADQMLQTLLGLKQ